jgi:hypothetical protein
VSWLKNNPSVPNIRPNIPIFQVLKPNSELNQLSHTIARRLALYLEHQGLLERDG